MEDPGKQPPDFAATEFSVKRNDYIIKSSNLAKRIHFFLANCGTAGFVKNYF